MNNSSKKNSNSRERDPEKINCTATDYVETNYNSAVNWDEEGQPLSTEFDDIYFSKKNGLEESRYVFLQHNHLKKRFTELREYETFVVGETGFGTGLNFLACWQLWQQHAPDSARLTYISVEKYPLHPDELKRSLTLWPELTPYQEELVTAYRNCFIGQALSQFQTLTFGNIRLLLLIDGAETGFQQLLASHHPEFHTPLWLGVDAWFLDGFAPAKNPEMWTEALFTLLGNLSKNNTTFATFTAAGQVKRNLISAGFTVAKVPGFAHKREMLVGHYTSSKTVTSSTATENFPQQKTKTTHTNLISTPWTVPKHFKKTNRNQSIAIIGAGLSGCHTAHALAKRGFKVTIIDRNSTIAAEASGNPQGVVYAKLSAHKQMLSEFNLTAILYAQQHYKHFWEKNPEHGQRCGVLQLSHTPRNKKGHEQIGRQFEHADFINYLNAERASTVANLPLEHSALFFPYCGWLNPMELCNWLLLSSTVANPITTVNNIHITNMELTNNRWKLTGTNSNKRHETENKIKADYQWQQEFDHVVIANANSARHFNQTNWLPTKPVRGQITYIESQRVLRDLQTVICADGYVAPATVLAYHSNRQPSHAIGASFNLHNHTTDLTDEDHQANINHLTQQLDQVGVDSPIEANGGRVGFRCTSPDYLPLVGLAPDSECFENDFKALSHNARTIVSQPGQYLPGLYLNIAHGSRGLAYTPIAAELLASIIAGEPSPMPQAMVNALNPARFLIRDLIRTNL